MNKKKLLLVAMMVVLAASFAMAERVRGYMYTADWGEPVAIWIGSDDNTVNTYIAWQANGNWYYDPSAPIAVFDEDTWSAEGDVWCLKWSGSSLVKDKSYDCKTWYLSNGTLYAYGLNLYYDGSPLTDCYNKSTRTPISMRGAFPKSLITYDGYFRY